MTMHRPSTSQRHSSSTTTTTNNYNNTRRGSRQTQQQTRAGHELSEAYSSLAAELTRKECKTVGGYTLGRVIGEGSFGKVRLGTHRLTNTRVAIKQVPKSLPSNSYDSSSSPLSLLTRELHHHRRLRHPHVLALYEIIATESSIYLVTELCTGGELFDYLVEKGRLSPLETRKIFGQLCLGVAHLHQQKVVHRDLKLENILLDERVNVKIADLGFGREFEKGRWMDTWVGTLGYCAPEVVAAKKYLGEEVDIWSLGVILYTLLAGSLPFDDDDEGVMKEMILKAEYEMPAWLDPDAADLISKILVLDPLRRPSLQEILAHAFFTRPARSISLDGQTYTHSHHHRRAESPHTTREGLPPVIFEESAASDSPVPETVELLGAELNPAKTGPMHSELSGSSNTSGSEPERNRSGATTPITSEEDSFGNVGLVPSATKQGKQRAIDGGDAEPRLGLLHRNESQTTIRKDGLMNDDGRSSTSDPVPAPRSAGPSSAVGRSTLPTSTEEEEHNLPASSSYASSLGLVAPPLQRNLSASSSTSFGSQTGSPIPVHSRTPSRTKRRSVGSTFSERLFALDEETPTITIDYFAMLSEPHASPLSTPQEQTLLDSLTTLGFDTGQIVHSITTHACDSSAAVWWMLKRKTDERERERTEAEMAMHSLPQSRQGSIRKVPSNDRFEERGRIPLVSRESTLTSVTSTSTATARPDDGVARSLTSPEMPQTPEAHAEERLSYFLHQSPLAASSPPILEYFPSTENASPQRRLLRTKSREHRLSDSIDSLRPASPSSSSKGTLAQLSPLSMTPPPTERAAASPGVDDPSLSPESKWKRTRSQSTSMLLARATSAIGLKKSGDANADDSRSDSPAPSLGKPAGGLFNRKSSLPSDDLRQLEAASATPSSPQRRASAGGLLGSSSTPLSTAPDLTAALMHLGVTVGSDDVKDRTPSTSSMVHSDSHETFDTITSTASAATTFEDKDASIGLDRRALPNPSKKGRNLFSNLKTWFGDDRRKRNVGTTKRGSLPLVVGHLDSSLSRSGSRRGGVTSPLSRPPLGSRKGSNGSHAGPPSRRSSISSLHRVGSNASPAIGLNRRRPSDASIATSEPRSRPGSIRSYSHDGIRSRKRHSSSTPSVISPKDVIKHQPITTTVHRVHPRQRSRHSSSAGAGGGSHSHSRNRSFSSVGTRHSSSSSAGGDDLDHLNSETDEAAGGGLKGKEPIIEEDEPLVDEPQSVSLDDGEEDSRRSKERDGALRTLSGDTSKRNSMLSESDAMTSPRTSFDAASVATTRSFTPPTRFTAHRTTHLFGAPSQPAPVKKATESSNAISSTTTTKPRGPIRDVFLWKEGEEWEDEDDEPAGGFGQSTSSRRPSAASQLAKSPNLAGGDADKFADSPARTGVAGEGGYWRRPTGVAPVAIEEEEEDEE